MKNIQQQNRRRAKRGLKPLSVINQVRYDCTGNSQNYSESQRIEGKKEPKKSAKPKSEES